MADFVLVDRMQARVALLAIGRSTLRSQGAAGVVAAARRYLRKLNLAEFAVTTRSDFRRVLDRHTHRLMKRFPNGARSSWGGARKALNIFLRDVSYCRLLSDHYRLGVLAPWLELPLDSNTYEGLVQDATEEQVVPKWPRIRYLDSHVSKELQAIAESVAKRFDIHPVDLDVRYWRRTVIDAL
jgi:hypothetical protein